jgi:hypothetical protein
MVRRQLLAAALVPLLAVPAGTKSNIVGTTVSGQAATVRGSALAPGTTVFHGDAIDVARKGAARINLAGGAVLQIGAESQVRLLSEKNQTVFEVTRGRASFRMAQGQAQGRLADATVRAAGAQPSIGTIAILDAHKAIIGSEKGELVVTVASGGVTLREGEGVEVTLAAPAAEEAGGGLSGVQVAVIGGVIAGLAIGIGVWASSRSDDLSEEARRNAVSPFRP